MGEQQQHKKRPRCSAGAEGSGGKKSSVLALSFSPVATAAPSAPAAPSPVATAKLGPTVAVTSPLAAMPPAPAAPNPAATTEGDTTTPAATVVVTSPVAAMAPAPAALSSAAIAKPAATVVDLEATSPVAVVKPEDEVAEQEGAAMAAGATDDVEVAILALPKKSFHCAACLCPLKPPVFRCENEHFMCHGCGGGGCGGDGDGANKHCGPCGRAVSYTHSRFMDGVVDAYKVPCLYKGHGCAMDDITYHSAADHKASCKHAPCYCFDCRFVGSPAKLVRHLASPSGAHAWPVRGEDQVRGAPAVRRAGVVEGGPAPPAGRGRRPRVPPGRGRRQGPGRPPPRQRRVRQGQRRRGRGRQASVHGRALGGRPSGAPAPAARVQLQAEGDGGELLRPRRRGHGPGLAPRTCQPQHAARRRVRRAPSAPLYHQALLN